MKTNTIETDSTTSSTAPTAATPPKVITVTEIAACLDHLKAISDVLAPYTITLTKAERRSATRFRKGGDTIIPLLARLATSAGVSGAAFDAEAMQSEVDLANALLPLLTQSKTLTDALGDTVLAAKGSAWSAATTLHNVLKRVSKNKPEMRRDMEAVSAAFAIKRDPAKAKHKGTKGKHAKASPPAQVPAPTAPPANGHTPPEAAPPAPAKTA